MTEPKRMKSSEIRADWAEVLQHVRQGGTVIVEHYNKPIADVVPHREPIVTKEEMRILIDLALAGQQEGPWDWKVEPDSPTYTEADAAHAIRRAIDLLDTLSD